MSVRNVLKKIIFLLALLCALNFAPLQSTDLIDAIKKGDIELTQVLIYSGASIDEADEQGDTPLIWAIQKSTSHPDGIKILAFLLDHNPNLDKQGSAQMPPIMIAYNKSIESSGPTKETALKIVDILFAAMTIPEKSCYLTFEQHDLNSAVSKTLGRSILMKIVSIATPQLLYKLLAGNYLLQDYCKAGKITLLASKFKVSNTIIPQLIVIIPQSLNELGIKIPESEKKKNEPSIDISFVENKFGFKNLTLLNPSYAASLFGTATPIDEYEFKKVLENFFKIIDINSPQHPTQLYLNGHGAAGRIAAIPNNLLEMFFAGLLLIDIALMYINSCYTAGTNLLAIQSAITAIIEKQIEEKETSKKTTSQGIDYAIVVQATSDIGTRGVGNIKAMFNDLNEFLKKPVWVLDFGPGVKKPRITISDVIGALGIESTTALPSIRLPGKSQFFRSIKFPDVEIVTESMVIQEGIKRTLELIAESKSPNTTIANDAKQQLRTSLGITINIKPTTRYIQIYPIDLTDFTFIIKNQSLPIFISKLAGQGHHFIGQIIIETPIHIIDQLVDKSFFDIAGMGKTYKTDHCWFIKSLEMDQNGDKTAIKKVAIKLYSLKGKQYYDYAYVDKNGEYIVVLQGTTVIANKKEFESTVRKWFQETIPSQETLTEATGGVEVTAKEKERLEKEKGGAQALRLLEPRFARTPEDLFTIFMAD